MVSREVPTEADGHGCGLIRPGLWREPATGFFRQPATDLAQALLGCLLVCSGAREGAVGGVIVETEAYTEDDGASHSRNGPTGRNRPMFGPGGFSYVYLIYGIHHCFNVTSGARGSGEAVLIRALEPSLGLDLMRRRRGCRKTTDLCSGPGKLCGALGIGLQSNGHDLRLPPLRVLAPRKPADFEVVATGRIGISRDADLPRRFVVAGSPFLSRRS